MITTNPSKCVLIILLLLFHIVLYFGPYTHSLDALLLRRILRLYSIRFNNNLSCLLFALGDRPQFNCWANGWLCESNALLPPAAPYFIIYMYYLYNIPDSNQRERGSNIFISHSAAQYEFPIGFNTFTPEANNNKPVPWQYWMHRI